MKREITVQVVAGLATALLLAAAGTTRAFAPKAWSQFQMWLETPIPVPAWLLAILTMGSAALLGVAGWRLARRYRQPRISQLQRSVLSVLGQVDGESVAVETLDGVIKDSSHLHIQAALDELGAQGLVGTTYGSLGVKYRLTPAGRVLIVRGQ